MKNLETQDSQLEKTIGRLEVQGLGKLPSQTMINPKENVSAITLRGKKQLDEMPLKAKKPRVKQNDRRILLLKKMRPLLQLKVWDHQKISLRILFHLLFRL